MSISIEKIKITVIVPIYNQEKFLKECLTSLNKQTLREIEILCINDGSTDNSLKILNDFLSIDSRIVIINQSNQGVGHARNVGIDAARGEYLCFMDGDDFYPNDMVLEKLYRKAKENDALICGGSWSEKIPNGRKYDFSDAFDGYIFHSEGWVDYRDYQFDFGYHRFIYGTSFLRGKHILFPEYKRYQDPVFFVKAMIAAERFYAVPEITYCYRIGHQNWSEWKKEKWNDLVKGTSDVLQIAKQNNLDKLFDYTCLRIHDASRVLTSIICNGQGDLFEILLQFNNSLKVSEYHFPLKQNFTKIFKCITDQKKEISNIRKSVSFRVGRTLTFLPRKIRNFLRK